MAMAIVQKPPFGGFLFYPAVLKTLKKSMK